MITALRLALASAVAAVLAALAAAPASARAEVAWLCHPTLAENPCELPLDTTVREPDGSETVVTPKRSRRRVDCFYVYPTVSNQLRPLATKARDPEIVSIAKYQAARYSSTCRVFAPIYRQRTVPALLTGELLGDGDPEIPFGDVEEAFRAFLAETRGRGFVLIAHSQGTFVLRALIGKLIDGKSRLRKRFAGAVLMGGNVAVRAGKARGGDFEEIPLCNRRGQFGCVVAYSTYAEDPPTNSVFGRVPADSDRFGLPGGEGLEAACTDPAKLSGIRGPVGVTVPSEPFAPGLIGVSTIQTYGGLPPTAKTTFLTTPDRFVGACRRINGAHVYRYDPLPGSRRPNPSPFPTWGTHLIDMNLGYERLVEIVRRQVRGWTRAQKARGRG